MDMVFDKPAKMNHKCWPYNVMTSLLAAIAKTAVKNIILSDLEL